MIWTTEPSTVLAEAPVWTALIEIDGGAIGGYWEIGSFTIARAPASIMAIAMTQAKTGRERKNLDIGAALTSRRRRRARPSPPPRDGPSAARRRSRGPPRQAPS